MQNAWMLSIIHSQTFSMGENCFGGARGQSPKLKKFLQKQLNFTPIVMKINALKRDIGIGSTNMIKLVALMAIR